MAFDIWCLIVNAIKAKNVIFKPQSRYQLQNSFSWRYQSLHNFPHLPRFPKTSYVSCEDVIWWDLNNINRNQFYLQSFLTFSNNWNIRKCLPFLSVSVYSTHVPVKLLLPFKKIVNNYVFDFYLICFVMEPKSKFFQNLLKENRFNLLK